MRARRPAVAMLVGLSPAGACRRHRRFAARGAGLHLRAARRRAQPSCTAPWPGAVGLRAARAPRSCRSPRRGHRDHLIAAIVLTGSAVRASRCPRRRWSCVRDAIRRLLAPRRRPRRARWLSRPPLVAGGAAAGTLLRALAGCWAEAAVRRSTDERRRRVRCIDAPSWPPRWLAGIAAAPAVAHVTIHPNALPAGGFSRVLVQVPNEREKAVSPQGRGPVPARSSCSARTSRCRAGRRPSATAPCPSRWCRRARPISREVAPRSPGRAGGSGTGSSSPSRSRSPSPTAPGRPSRSGPSRRTATARSVRWTGVPSADMPAPRVVVTPKTSPVRDLHRRVSAGGPAQVALPRPRAPGHGAGGE